MCGLSGGLAYVLALAFVQNSRPCPGPWVSAPIRHLKGPGTVAFTHFHSILPISLQHGEAALHRACVRAKPGWQHRPGGAPGLQRAHAAGHAATGGQHGHELQLAQC
eukprot:s386_g8.t1